MYYLIANEKHFKGKKAKKLDVVKSVLKNAGKDYEILLTREAHEAKILVEKITSSGEKHTIVALGGDGTLHDIINGFKDFDNCSLGLIPVGTGNDFATGAKIPKDIKKAAEIIAYNQPKPIDFIELSSGLRSINAVGMGIDVEVLRHTYAGNKRGKGKYLRAFIASVVNFKSCNFTIRYDGKEEKHFGMIAALGNGKQIGGGIKLFPEAELNDGYMDLFMVDYISKPRLLGCFIKLMRGKVNSVKQATAIKVKQATLIPDNENFSIQAEGELYDNVPIDAHVVEGKLKFFLPE